MAKSFNPTPRWMRVQQSFAGLTSRRGVGLIFPILILGLFLRVIGLNWGLPGTKFFHEKFGFNFFGMKFSSIDKDLIVELKLKRQPHGMKIPRAPDSGESGFSFFSS